MRSKRLLIREIIRLITGEGYEYPEAETKALQGYTGIWPAGDELVRLYNEEIARQDERFEAEVDRRKASNFLGRLVHHHTP